MSERPVQAFRVRVSVYWICARKMWQASRISGNRLVNSSGSKRKAREDHGSLDCSTQGCVSRSGTQGPRSTSWPIRTNRIVCSLIVAVNARKIWQQPPSATMIRIQY